VGGWRVLTHQNCRGKLARSFGLGSPKGCFLRPLAPARKGFRGALFGSRRVGARLFGPERAGEATRRPKSRSAVA